MRVRLCEGEGHRAGALVLRLQRIRPWRLRQEGLVGEVGVGGEAGVLGGVEGLGVLLRVGQVRGEGLGAVRLGLGGRVRRGQVERVRGGRGRRRSALGEEGVQRGGRRRAGQGTRGEDGGPVRQVGVRRHEGGVRGGEHLREVRRGGRRRMGEVGGRVLLHVDPRPGAVVGGVQGQIHRGPAVRVQPVTPGLGERVTPRVVDRVSPRVQVSPGVVDHVRPRVVNRVSPRVMD